MKKFLCALLALALTLALLIPASALPNPDYIPNITQQPSKRLFVVQGGEIKLETQAEAPKESDGSPLRYQWTKFVAIDQGFMGGPVGFFVVEGAQDATLTLPTAGMLLNDAASLYFRCVVTATLKDGSEAAVTSDTCWVFLYYDCDGAKTKVRDAWNNARVDFSYFVAFSHVVSQLYFLAVTPVQFAMDWLNYEGMRRL